MSTFGSEFNEWLQKFIERDKSNLDEYDKSILLRLQTALHNLQLVEWGLAPVYNDNGFYQSLPLIEQQKAGMTPDTEPYQKADFQVLANRHILDFLALLHFDHTETYLSDCFKKITRVEAGDVISTMKKDEHRRETEKRKKGGGKSHERKIRVLEHVAHLAITYLNSHPPKPWTLSKINDEISDDFIIFLRENPDLPQSKKILSAPNENSIDVSKSIGSKLTELKKMGKLRPFIE